MLSSILSIVVFMQQDAKEIYKNLTPSMVAIKTDVASGSGFVLKSNGVICTAAHVIENAKTVTVRFSDGKEYESTGLIDVDEKNDVAVFRARFLDRPEVKMQTKAQEIGSKLFIVSAPLGLEFSISEGILSQYRTFESAQMLQHTCQTSPGSSGGAVCNQTGEVVGVHNSKRVGGEGLNFAVAAEHVAGLDLTLPTIKWESYTWKAKKKSVEQSPLDKKAVYKKYFEAIWKPLSELYYIRDSADDVQVEVTTKSINNVVLSTSILRSPEICKINGDYFKSISQTFNGDTAFPNMTGDLLDLSSRSYQLANAFANMLSAFRDAQRHGWQSTIVESFDESLKNTSRSIAPDKFAESLLKLANEVETEPSFEYRFVEAKTEKIYSFEVKTQSNVLISRLPTFKLGLVDDNSLLKKSGVESGDVILSIGGKHPLDALDDFLKALDVPGDKIDLVVRKLSGSTKNLSIRTKKS